MAGLMLRVGTDVAIPEQRVAARAAKSQLFILGIHTVQLEGVDSPSQDSLCLFARRKLSLLLRAIKMHRHFEFVAGVVVQMMLVLDFMVTQTGVVLQRFLPVLDHNDRVRVGREAAFNREQNQFMNSGVVGKFNDLFLNGSRPVKVDFDYFSHLI